MISYYSHKEVSKPWKVYLFFFLLKACSYLASLVLCAKQQRLFKQCFPSHVACAPILDVLLKLVHILCEARHIFINRESKGH